VRADLWARRDLLPRLPHHRENRHIIGKVSTTRFARPVAEKVDVVFPFTIQEARFNLPLKKGRCGPAAASSPSRPGCSC